MRISLCAVAVAVSLIACVPTVQEWRDYGDNASCVSYNITPVDPDYPQCRAVFAQMRAQQQENAMRALTNHGAYLADQVPPVPLIGPVGVPPPMITNCRSVGDAVDCYSQIY